MKPVAIRQMSRFDSETWLWLRRSLWPEEREDGHRIAMEEILSSKDAWGFVAEGEESAVLGFAEISIRKAANGCESQPVPFLEGIWVELQYRQRGIGSELLRHIEAFLAARGFHELGSDSLIDNNTAHHAHRSWGFTETERVIYFRKCF
jgi:aminoglycoside 6'-N-acetyltransferase I